MRKKYEKPLFQVIEMIEKAGVMQAGGDGSVGEVGGGHAWGKENDTVWDEEGSFDLWENDEDDDNLWNNE